MTSATPNVPEARSLPSPLFHTACDGPHRHPEALPYPKTILIIENNPAIAEMLARALSLAGYAACIALDHMEARCPMHGANTATLPALLIVDRSVLFSGKCSSQDERTDIDHRVPRIVLTTNPTIYERLIALHQRVLLKPFHMHWNHTYPASSPSMSVLELRIVITYKVAPKLAFMTLFFVQNVSPQTDK